MIYKSDQIEIRMAREMGLNHLEFRFYGYFSADASQRAAMVWGEVFENNPEMTYSLVWDCSQMTGFDPAARKEWYRTLKKYKSRIIDVVVISPSLLIRSAARVMLEFFGLGSRIARSRQELLQVAV